MKKCLFFVVGICMPLMNLVAQQEISALTTGDTIPPIVFKRIINANPDSINLLGLKKKLIILDFWGTFCSACINSFPNLQSLQHQFQEDLQIILVDNFLQTGDTEVKFQRFFSEYKSAHFNFSLPIALENSSCLKALLPIKYVPYCFWISPDGTLLWITGSDEVNAENIRSVLNGFIPTTPPNCITNFNNQN